MKFLHLKSKEDPHHNVVSIGYEVQPTELQVQVARCHAPDSWCRHIAHKIIRGRFETHGPCKTYSIENFATFNIAEVLGDDWHPDYGKEVTRIPF